MKHVRTISIYLALTFLLVPSTVLAQSLQDQINTLNTQIKQNQDAANSKHAEASTLQDTISVLNTSIAASQTSLDSTTLQIKKNQAEIDAQNIELDRQKNILKDNLRTIYRRGEVSPLEIVASSKDLSDFVAQQEYLAAIKKKIDSNLKKIEDLKKELDTKKAEFIILAGQQKAQVDTIANQRQQKASLLAQTQGDEAKFQQNVAALDVQRKKAEDQVKAQAAAAIASFKSGKLVSLGAVNQGDVIGYMGSTGNSTGTHLHFSLLNQSGQFVNPSGYNYQDVTDGSVTQGYGPATCHICGYSFHNGIDIADSSGPAVRAAKSGQIVFNGSDPYGFGHKVMILHPDGFITLYGHLAW